MPTTALALEPHESIQTDGPNDRIVIAADYQPDGDVYVIIVGRVETDTETNSEYLGCQGCGQEITRFDAGMCVDCRSDLAARDFESVSA